MFRIFILFLLLLTSIHASKVDHFRWPDGVSYLMFLEQHKLPVQRLYYDLDRDDQKLLEEVRAGTNCQKLVSMDGELLQALIPMNDELQVHLYKEKDEYFFEIIPIISDTKREAFVLEITHSPYLDIMRETGSKKLAQIFVANYKYSLNFKRDLRKGDTLIMMYDQKYRLGKPFSMPILKAAMIEMQGKKHYIYHNSKMIDIIMVMVRKSKASYWLVLLKMPEYLHTSIKDASTLF